MDLFGDQIPGFESRDRCPIPHPLPVSHGSIRENKELKKKTTQKTDEQIVVYSLN